MEHRAPGRARVTPACPVRDGDRCNLCQPGATGPHDCGLVWLVMSDEDLRAEYVARRRATPAERT